MKTYPIAIVIAPLLAACSSSGERGPGGKLTVEVAPLELDGIVEARYRLTVRNADPAPDNIVWQEEVLSTRYGDGRGSATYIGTCDASRAPGSVELELLELRDDEIGALTSPRDFANPAPEGDPIRRLDIDCQENADTLVRFDLTILRRAKQGFFDVAVDFSDVFCSAKLDCRPALLHDGDVRGPTALVTFACTAGDGGATWMYLSDLSLTCANPDGSGAVTTTIPIAGREDGQQGPLGAWIYQWAQYRDREFEAQADFEKCFWNYAVGLDTAALAGKTCTLSAVGTASDGPLADMAMPSGGAYPYLSWSVDVWKDGALCSNNALGAVGSGVQPDYVRSAAEADALPPFAAELRCGDAPPVACGTGTPVGDVVVQGRDGGFTVEIARGGATGTTDIALPEGWHVADGCCQAECCAAD